MVLEGLGIKMKIMTLGAGFIANHLPYEKIIERLIPWQSQIGCMLEFYKPDVIVNCIGFCGIPNIDQCEIQQEKTVQSNTIIPMMLAMECDRLGIHLIHIGSGCIFYGKSPNLKESNLGKRSYSVKDIGWKENDIANPKSFYSRSKYAADLVLAQIKSTTVLRIRMPVSTKNEPRNFINKVKGYSKVIDIPNSMTFVDDLVRCVDWVAKESKTGIYHVVNPGVLSAAKVLREYQKYNTNHKFDIITEEELDQLVIAKRSNCIINGDKLASAGFVMTPADEALKVCMEKYVE